MTGRYNRTIFYDIVRRELFPSGMAQSQVDGMNVLLDYIEQLGWLPDGEDTQYFKWWASYLFGTAGHETAWTMQPIEEYGKGSGKSYGKPDPQTGKTYYGRGFVQLTWKENYQKSDSRIASQGLISPETLATLPDAKVDQVWHPEQALNLEIAACNLMVGCWEGWYTGKKLTNYLTNTTKDYYNARRIVNGLDKASQIKGYAQKFEKAFVGSWEVIPTEVPPPVIEPPMPDPSEPSPEPEHEHVDLVAIEHHFDDGSSLLYERGGA